MSNELKILERWLQYGFFQDTNDIGLEFKIALIAENVYNLQFPQIEGLDIGVLLLVASINFFKSTNQEPNFQNIYDSLVTYNNEKPYDSDNKIEWMNSFIEEYKTITLKQEQL